MSEDCRLIYFTAPNHDEALRIVRVIVSERLAACGNVLGEIRSVYWWDGKLNEEGEVAALLKTRQSLVDVVIERARQEHPYDCPCVVSLPIEAGNPAFLSWVNQETRS